MLDLDALFAKVVAADASDLHLRVGSKPRLRIHGELQVEPGSPEVAAADLATLLAKSLHEGQRRRFEEEGEVDCSFLDATGARYRANFFRDAAGIAASFRCIPSKLRTLGELGLPDEVEELAHLRHGLVLVTGATGSGKSSTLAAVIDLINARYARHVVTLEDPVEFVHVDQRSMVRQRSVGDDVPSFASGVRDALRADVDVLLIGELRDLETTRAALSAAETGMLVFATLHTNDAAQTVDRLIDVFPPGEQEQVRAMLAESLQAVLSQVLLPRADHQGRVVATEMLVSTSAIEALIREGRTHDIPTFLQSGRDKGMWRLDDSLEKLLRQGVISRDEALSVARNRTRFDNRKPSLVSS